MNKNYKKFVCYILSNCDAIAFEIESFEAIYDVIKESDILEQFNVFIKPRITGSDNYCRKYEIYRKKVLNNEKKDRKTKIIALKSLNKINKNLLFKNMVFDFGANHYEQKSKNLILGYSINTLIYKYLIKYNNVLKYNCKKPSTIALYSKGKCIYFINSLDKIIYSLCDDLLNFNIKNYNIVINYKMNNILYPYIKNDNANVSVRSQY